MDKKTYASELIDALGGTCVVADLCDIKPPSVSGWRNNGIPRPWMKFLRLARPDVFEEIKRTTAHNHEAG